MSVQEKVATCNANRRERPARPKNGLGRILEKFSFEIWPSPENDQIYKPISPDDPDLADLVTSIRQYGIREPLTVTEDGYILSGHRRFAAGKKAGLAKFPCRVELVSRSDLSTDDFVALLREHNRQRVKSVDEVFREELVSANPEEAYRRLKAHREQAARVEADTITIVGTKRRAEITKAKGPFLQAIMDVLNEYRSFWPLSVRQVHYYLLNDPPLMHASKPGSRYANNPECYKSLDELITRARLCGRVPFNAIHDPTRPVTVWQVHRDVGPFIRRELDQFLKGYHRDLQQSQPLHIEIVGEKNTVGSIIRPVAWDYTIPYTLNRGYCSIPPRAEMVQRFKKSGKDRLLVLVLSDFDPEGEDIGHSFARSLRDDFGVENVDAIKVALTSAQVSDLQLPPAMQAKKTSSRAKKFTARHGNNVFELEAVAPRQLQDILREAIDSVLDVDAFNAEVDAEAEDAARLESIRRELAAKMGESFDA